MALDEQLYQSWLLQLQTWAADDLLLAAGVEALQLKPGKSSQLLKRIVNRLAEGVKRDLPPIEVLPGSAMAGAMGAYASATGTIYLNRDWLTTASTAAVQAVLTEEFGHHLDQLLSERDTQGDEGEIFANFLVDPRFNHQDHHVHKEARNDEIKILVKGKWIHAEAALRRGDIRSDTLNGTADSDTIEGLDGADSLNGQAGNDHIYGGQGKDTIHGGLGNDHIEGGNNADILWGDSPDDPASGGNDTIQGNQGRDTIYGGPGNDSISGGDGSSNLIYGGTGDDLIQSFGFNSNSSDDRSKDTMYGGAGDDTLKGSHSQDIIRGNGDSDLIIGNNGKDSLYGGNGNDTINGNSGCLLYTSPSPRDISGSRMPSSA